ncbi:MAG: efflux RND transporter periplasmic adaptor subunit [Bacteroidota bacterium]
MKTGRLLLILSLVLIGVTIYFKKCNNSDKAKAPDAAKGKQPLSVNGVIVSAEPLEYKLYSSGTVMANEEVQLRNEVQGRIIAINFKEGTKVKKGDLLVKLFDDDLKAQLKKLELQKELAEKSESRQKDLLEAKGISQQDFEIAQNNLNSIKADIEIIRSAISKTEIRAPFDGSIGLKSVSLGAFIAANTVIASIQDIDPLKIEFTVPERFRDQIAGNTEITFTSESAPGTFKGKIYAFEPRLDITTRSFTVRAICPNSDQRIFPGAFAHVTIPLKVIKDAIQVPTQSVIPELKGQSVYISEGGLAKKTMVETGIRSDSSIQITSGIQPGDTVLITGMMQVRPKVPLKITVVN